MLPAGERIAVAIVMRLNVWEMEENRQGRIISMSGKKGHYLKLANSQARMIESTDRWMMVLDQDFAPQGIEQSKFILQAFNEGRRCQVFWSTRQLCPPSGHHAASDRFPVSQAFLGLLLVK